MEIGPSGETGEPVIQVAKNTDVDIAIVLLQPKAGRSVQDNMSRMKIVALENAVSESYFIGEAGGGQDITRPW